MNGRGIASFLAGMGTGYFNAEEKKKDRERQEKKDKMEQEKFDVEMSQIKSRQGKDDALDAGMKEAGAMKAGQIRDEQGAVDTSTEAYQKRLEANGVDPTIASQTAPIYAERSKQKGAEGWMKDSFGNPAEGGIGNTKATTESDIKRKQAEAYTAGGQYDKAISANESAHKLDIEEMQSKILAAKDFDEIDKIYDIVPDGFKIKSEVSKEDGRFRYWYEGEDGNKITPSSNLPQDFADFNEFKTFASAYVKQNPEYITTAWDKAHSRKREGVQDKRAENQDARAGEKHDVDMQAGKLGIQGAQSDLKVKQATEGSRIEEAGLSPKLKRAQIANVYDEISKRKTESSNKTTEAQYKANEEKRKGGDQYRQDLNAAVAIFDKSFKRDQMGNLIGDELDSKNYSEASNVIGAEIKKGASVDDAQAIGRLVYDEAKNGGVSVKTAYSNLVRRLEDDKKPTKAIKKSGGGAAAVDSYFDN